jgi:nitroreductase
MKSMKLNDRTSTLSLLETRRSARPRDLVPPGPASGELDTMLRIAARTPDHGKLSPWRFVVIADDKREELAELFRAALAREDPDAPAAKVEKAVDLARSPGALVVVLSAPIEAHKVPVWEQQLSCGAAAMNLLWAAHAMGFVGGWITGWQAYSPVIADAICGPGERIAGFVFIGQPGRELEERPRAPLETVVRDWPGPAA